MKAWDIFDAPESVHLLDTVFFDDDCEPDYVRRCLIEHDGFPNSIEIRHDDKIAHNADGTWVRDGHHWIET